MKRLFSVLLIAVFLIAPAAGAQAATWYVKTDGTDPGDCSGGNSWASAYATIQKAINCATASDEIWVKQGTYDISSAQINVNKAVDIYGGFVGTESALGQRDWAANTTTVDGGDAIDHCFYVTADATIDGFTITGGDADSGTYPHNNGGGIMNDASDPTIANCIIDGNSTTYGGGGIFNYNFSYPTIVNCVVSGNTAANKGGGIYNYNSDPTITNCSISGNTATVDGGGIYNLNSDPTITNCILWGNTAPIEPEIYNDVNSTPTVTYCDVQGGYTGTGNINSDPLFVGGGDYHLQSGSPCINVGNNTPSGGLPTYDFEGDPRIVNTTVDMGADEYVPTVYHCVSDASGLTTALSTAQSNNADDIIQVVQGTYTDNFSFSSSEGYAISVLGGYTSGCAGRVIDPANTVLDAGGSGRVLGLTNSVGGDIMVEGLTILQGNSSQGSGIQANSSSSTGDSGDITIQANTIIGNTGTGSGVYALSESTSDTAGDIALTDNTISGNTGTLGGGVFAASVTSTGTAGAITLQGNTISGNTAIGTQGGGGVYVYSHASSSGTAGAATLTGNIISENTADQIGGVYAGSQSIAGNSGAVTLVNNIIAGNTAVDGSRGGVWPSSEASGTTGAVTLTNNTITGNSATVAAGGAHLYATNANKTVDCYNNIIWGNTAPTGADISLVGTAGTTTSSNNNYSTINGSWDSESGYLNVDPEFIDPDHGDFRLRSSSLCKDAGHDTPPALPATDFEGDARWIDTSVDIGADEVSVVTTCVSTAGELTTALGTADDNGVGDVIMVQQGTYTGNFFYTSIEGYSIYLYGGYTSGCASRVVNPVNTVLDGGGSGMVLQLSSPIAPYFTVDGFTIQHGGATGLSVLTNNTNPTGDIDSGDIEITNNIITSNTSASNGGALLRTISTNGSSGNITVVNNIISGNTTTSTGYLSGIEAVSSSSAGTAGTVTLTNNTITGNINPGGSSWGGAYISAGGTSGSGIVNCYNNIIRGNTPVDIWLGGVTRNGYNNNYTSISGSWTNSGGNINADPLFVGGGVYRLRPDSPCIDTGTNVAPSFPTYDFEGEDRIIDGDRDDTDTVDRGADEYSGHLPPCDYDADGHTDIGVYRPDTGWWYLKRSTLGYQAANWGGDGTDIAVPEDFDGDGETDITIYRSSNGWWYVKGVGNYLYGGPGYIPIPADYDGDGAIDLGVYTSSTGWWYVKGVGNYLFGGLADDIPVPGDYDGDGSIDVAVYRSSTGWWYVKGIGQYLFGGLPDDIPVPGDYDGDGTTDIALFRPSTGWWYIRGVGSYLHGTSGDIPVPGDYDRDGVTEIGVFRPSEGKWYIKGAATVPIWGLSTDIPLTRNMWIWQQTGVISTSP